MEWEPTIFFMVSHTTEVAIPLVATGTLTANLRSCSEVGQDVEPEDGGSTDKYRRARTIRQRQSEPDMDHIVTGLSWLEGDIASKVVVNQS